MRGIHTDELEKEKERRNKQKLEAEKRGGVICAAIVLVCALIVILFVIAMLTLGG